MMSKRLVSPMIGYGGRLMHPGLAASAMIALFMCGCVVRTPASPDRVIAPLAPAGGLAVIQWPQRVKQESSSASFADELAAVFSPLGAYGRGRLYKMQRDLAAADDRAFVLLFVSERPKADPSTNRPPLTLTISGRHSITFPPTVNGTALVVIKPEPGQWRAPSQWNGRPARANVQPIESPPLNAHVTAVKGTRGIAIYLSSLQGLSDPEHALLNTFVRRGWTAVCVIPSGEALAGGRLYMGRRGNEGPLADSIARTLESFFAEHAYAVEAALAYLNAVEPELSQRPLALLGGSIGAAMLPAVAASLDEPPDAAVLIGGGADFLRMMMSSPIGRDRVRIMWTEQRTANEEGEDVEQAATVQEGDLEALFEATLERFRLDPYHAAEALAGVPVLLLHARWDAIVPARFGDVLYERLGRPERWVYATGHVGLFFNLFFEAGRVARWVERAVSEGPRETRFSR